MSSRKNGTARPRLILLTQWFDPEPTFKGILFARALRDRGYDVEVVTGFPNYPGGKVYPGYKLRVIQKEDQDGIRITRLPLYPSHDKSVVGRLLNYLSFSFTAALYLTFFARRADIMYVYHPPLTVSIAAAFANLIRRTPMVVDIQDLWPDTLAATGMIKAAGPLKIVGWICQKVYARAAHIAVLSPGFKTLLIERGVPAQKISVVYNWADESALAIAAGSRPDAMSTNGRFRILFAGNMGLAQDLDVVLDAAKLVADKEQHIDFCFLGDGLAGASLKRRVMDEEIRTVTFFPKVPMSEVGAYLAAADVLLVNLRPDPLFEITIPSKTQAYMSAGKPIIMAVAGDAANLVSDAGAGIVISPGDPHALAEAVLDMARLSPQKIADIGIAAKKYYDARLSLARGVDAFIDIFETSRRRTAKIS